MTGNISEVQFTALSKLSGLSIYETSLSFHVNSNWTPPFQLEYLEANSCKMGPKFPAWLKTQKSLSYLLLSSSGIVNTTPNWFWNFISYIQQIHLSDNQISRELSQVVLNNTIIDLSSNISFFGNVELCGAPLSKNCPGDEEEIQRPTGVGENREYPEIAWFYVGMESGFFVGIWGVCGCLFFNKAWRHAYFQYLDDIKDSACVAIAIKMKWLHQKLGIYNAGNEKPI